MAVLAWRAPSYICKSGLFMAARMTAGSGGSEKYFAVRPLRGACPVPHRWVQSCFHLWGEEQMLVGLQFWDEALGLLPGPTRQEEGGESSHPVPGMGAELPASSPACTGHFWQRLLADPTPAPCFPIFGVFFNSS